MVLPSHGCIIKESQLLQQTFSEPALQGQGLDLEILVHTPLSCIAEGSIS